MVTLRLPRTLDYSAVVEFDQVWSATFGYIWYFNLSWWVRPIFFSESKICITTFYMTWFIHSYSQAGIFFFTINFNIIFIKNSFPLCVDKSCFAIRARCHGMADLYGPMSDMQEVLFYEECFQLIWTKWQDDIKRCQQRFVIYDLWFN